MAIIQVLDQNIANKIAAGEVVERPGSVIKELVENSLDAGATHITVEIKNGGITYMRVTDDGCGMEKEDAKTCFLRHATSKIRDLADLYAIQTLGFRGEALAAISSVSRIELHTSTGGIGSHLVLDGGKETLFEEVGAPKGTTIVVRDLFFNTPARMKFLKTDRSEGGFVAALMDRLALSHPHVSFRLIQDEKVTLSTDGNGKLLDVIYSIWGKEITKGMLQADAEIQQVRVYGYVGEPTVTKNNRNFQLCYINDRLVRSQTVFAAIDQAYRNNLFHGRHAVCVLKLVIPHGLVDVNVHPGKMEVKFSNEKLVFEAVYYAIKNALNKQTLLGSEEKEVSAPAVSDQKRNVAPKTAPKAHDFGAVEVLEQPVSLISNLTKEKASVKIQEDNSPIVSMPKPLSASRKSNFTLHEEKEVFSDEFKKISQNLMEKRAEKRDVAADPPIMKPIIRKEAPLVEEKPKDQEKKQPKEAMVQYRFIGELFSTYLLIESGSSLYLIDKHAAHERMIFERLLKERNAQKPAQQQMLVPETLRLSQEECLFALEHQAEFTKIGYEIDAFGDRKIILRSRPLCLTNETATEAFSEILSEWMNGGKKDFTDRENLALKTMACKSAIKAGNINDRRELETLIEKLIREDEIHQCPHGRPIMIAYSKNEIEKAFKRI